MGMIEAPFGDLMLGILQNPAVRWGAAGVAWLWVFIIGDEDAILRKGYLFAPLAVAGIIEMADGVIQGAGRASWFSVYLMATEALKRMASPLGLMAFVGALACGYGRLVGGAYLLIIIVSAYFADQLVPGSRSFFTPYVLGEMVRLMPAVLVLLLIAYGIGAILRWIRERFHVA